MFLQKSKIQIVGNSKTIFVTYFISEIPNFSYMRIFQKMLNVLSDHS